VKSLFGAITTLDACFQSVN